MERKNRQTMKKSNRDRQQQRYRGGRATTDLGEQQRETTKSQHSCRKI